MPKISYEQSVDFADRLIQETAKGIPLSVALAAIVARASHDYHLSELAARQRAEALLTYPGWPVNPE
jgi:hypothetical protein